MIKHAKTILYTCAIVLVTSSITLILNNKNKKKEYDGELVIDSEEENKDNMYLALYDSVDSIKNKRYATFKVVSAKK